MISFDETVCSDLAAGSRKEWLETNGLGGYASSTINGMNTRRYHALFVAAKRPPTDRVVILSKLEETLIKSDNNERFQLSTNQYPQTVYPQGYRLLKSFRLDPFPVFTFRTGDLELVKTVFMLQGSNTTVVRYRLNASPQTRVRLQLAPLVAFRDYHSMIHESHDINTHMQVEPGLVRINLRANEPALVLTHDAARVVFEGVWYRNFEYAEERARGFDFREDLYNPCTLTFEMRGGMTCSLIASTDKHEASEAATFEQHERARRHNMKGANEGDSYLRSLYTAAEQFIVRRGSNKSSLIAGYHWFTDWGRDTMISLPGLVLLTERGSTAREILSAFADYLSEGMIPNRFPDEGDQPEYNTVDATLWMVHAVGEYLRRTNDTTFVYKQLYDRLKGVVEWHERGTRYGIRVDTDGLLRAGVEGVQLTWMDAKVGDWVVTPRSGKAVEIQALWYNALCIIEDLAARVNDEATRQHCNELAVRAHQSFNEKFWNEDAGCLYDVVRDDHTGDATLRPNQIFAVSLPHSMLDETRARRVVEVVQRDLLTPYGLRSLSPHDPAYRPRYEGNALARDGAYHQGTVWAWLIGPFITAYLKVNNRTPDARLEARSFFSAFREHMMDAGLGQVSEIFDGDPPHTPRGCIAQAWSVAELLRCEVEEL